MTIFIEHLKLFLLTLVFLWSNSTVLAQTYTFTTCNQTGATGPNQSQCNSAYSSTTLAGAVSISTQGYQEWVIPSSGIYQIEVWGASGGNSGGSGAKMRGNRFFSAGEVLRIVVGQQATGRGGGGGTFVTQKNSSSISSDTALLISGGGGGRGGTSPDNSLTASTSTSGKDAQVTGVSNLKTGKGGINGGGGGGGISGSGGGGGGWIGNGGNANIGTYSGSGGTGGNAANGQDGQGAGGLTTTGTGGTAYKNGATGGSSDGSHDGNGGFGGGGGVKHWNSSGGGGGGYSGGGGGAHTGSDGTSAGGNHDGGGGGGSYGGSLDSGWTSLADSATLGYNTGNGQVTITLLGAGNQPSQPIVTDGIYNTSNSQLSISWTLPNAGTGTITDYMIAVGTSPGSSNLKTWYSPGLVQNTTITGLSLTDGQTVYASVRAKNSMGIWSNASSGDGVIIDGSKPKTPLLNEFSVTATSLVANWYASSDSHSGILQYEIAVGNTPGASNLMAWTSVGTATSFNQSSLNLGNGNIYFVSVRSKNNAGLYSEVINESISGSTVNTCGRTGHLGPTQSQCDSYNMGSELETYISNQGYQEWTVPGTGTYRIEAWGASGGNSGGPGAKVRGDIALTGGDVLRIVVGQQATGRGGGGGTFVTQKNNSSISSDTALLIAGGGGGRGGTSPDNSLTGSTSTSGKDAQVTGVSNLKTGKGGINGGGGGGGISGSGGGGGGWIGNGGNANIGTYSGSGGTGGNAANGQDGQGVSGSTITGTGGTAYKNGATGGSSDGGNGGFGGGGGVKHWNSSGGGGGGYSGGGGGAHTGSDGTSAGGNHDGGGGGGSYMKTIDLIWTSPQDSNTLGYNTGDGKVLITLIGSGPSPDAPNVVDDGTYTVSQAALSARWVEPNIGVGSITEYQYAIGTSPSSSDVTGWTNIGNNRSFTKTGLSLSEGTTYYILVKAKNSYGNWSQAGISNGITVDTSKPSTPGLISMSVSNTSLIASWTSSTDSQSGVVLYEYAVGSSPGATDLLFWTANGTNTSVNRNDLNLGSGPYYISIRSQNGAGLYSHIANLVVNYTLSTCSQTGHLGPTQSQCNTAYSGSDLSVQVNTQGYQEWTVPGTGTYRIEAWGASGGNSGGPGAKVRGDMALTGGAVLRIVVGQQATGRGGGGGTFVTQKNSSSISSDTALLIAGGGGGRGSTTADNPPNSLTGSTSTSGKDAQATGVSNLKTGKGGINGGGGGGGISGSGGGGGGWIGNGGNANIGTYSGSGGTGGNAANGQDGQGVSGSTITGTGGTAYKNGATGGSSDGGNGGFGGGGGVKHWNTSGGGGGGYSGGGGGAHTGLDGTSAGGNHDGGGGGGSYINGSIQNALNSDSLGYNTGDGQVSIILTNSFTTDTDADGVPDGQDNYPNDANKVVDLPSDLLPFSGNITMWLNGASPNAVEQLGNAISTWYDFSGNRNHATQTTASAKPLWLLNNFNGLPAPYFDGTSDFMNLPNGSIPYGNFDYTIVVFFQPNVQPASADSPNQRGLLSSGSNGNNLANSIVLQYQKRMANLWGNNDTYTSDNSVQLLKPAVVLSSYDHTAGRTMYYQGTSDTNGNHTSTNRNSGSGSQFIGRGLGSTEFWQGYIGEVIVLNRAVSLSEANDLFNYLQNKWNVINKPTKPIITILPISRSNAQISPQWTASNGNGLSITSYEYSIGTSPGLTDIVDWTDVGNVQSVIKSGLRLIPGRKYYMNVRAFNEEDTRSATESAVFRVPGHYIGF